MSDMLPYNIILCAIIICAYKIILSNQVGFPFATIPPGHKDEMFDELMEYEELFFIKRSYHDFIEGMKERKQLNHPKVEELFYKVRRADFMNVKPMKGFANIVFGYDYQVAMENPSYHALVLEQMVDHIKNGSRVLDIGSGQGYMATCLAQLVGTHGKVYALEHVPQTVNESIKNIKIACPDLLEKKTLEVLVKDGRWGHPEGGPYDVIFFGAATPEVSKTILDQVKPNGRVVAPVGSVWRQNLSVIDKHPNGTYSSKIIRRTSQCFLCDLQFQLNPSEYQYPINESNEDQYTKIFPPPPGVRYRDVSFFDQAGTTKLCDPTDPNFTYIPDSTDDRYVFPQAVLDIIHGVNKCIAFTRRRSTT